MKGVNDWLQMHDLLRVKISHRSGRRDLRYKFDPLVLYMTKYFTDRVIIGGGGEICDAIEIVHLIEI